MKIFVILLSLLLWARNEASSETSKNIIGDRSAAFQWLQNQIIETSIAQQSVMRQLHDTHLIPVGKAAGSLLSKRRSDDRKTDEGPRITQCTKDNNVECRISLGTAPIGSILVSPCGCLGSQKWIQFSELNNLRRKDPSQWSVCQTCQQKFDYEIFTERGQFLIMIIVLIF